MVHEDVLVPCVPGTDESSKEEANERGNEDRSGEVLQLLSWSLTISGERARGTRRERWMERERERGSRRREEGGEKRER